MLRLPHVFTQPLSKFEAFGDRNSRAMDYSLDKPSYYRLTDRLGLGSVNDTSDMEYLRTVKPGSQNNSNYSGILSPLVSHPSVYDSTENNPSQSQAEPHYPREDLELSVSQKPSRLVRIWSWLRLDRLLRN
ncbi:hypothetical protein OCU04_004602 [Sclerotinia nivalis]|uniref:Uncharacterized protein n=1 Tax=Sclerotinia nivalis TaxID=352851 RepID=A0A9X0ARQ7_9HELO|nr:hypothetical protein OCU04_004602 [Sclerotinia nivalis]